MITFQGRLDVKGRHCTKTFLGTLRERNNLMIMMTAAMMTRFPQLGLQKFHGGDEARERQSKGPGWQQCQFYRGPRPRREILATTGVYLIFVQSGNNGNSIAGNTYLPPLLFLMFSIFLQSEVQNSKATMQLAIEESNLYVPDVLTTSSKQSTRKVNFLEGNQKYQEH